MDFILKYFPELTNIQISQFDKLKGLYTDWNSKINVISRKDIDNIYINHVLHSLAIAKIISFKKNTTILDVGTGGGFPGVPLAILFPEAKFLLIDSISKKIKVVNSVVNDLKLTNVEANQINVINLDIKFDFIVSRAVTTLEEFYPLVKKNISKNSSNKLNNGILYIKGGDVDVEIDQLKSKFRINNVDTFNIYSLFSEDYFETKKVIYISAF